MNLGRLERGNAGADLLGHVVELVRVVDVCSERTDARHKGSQQRILLAEVYSADCKAKQVVGRVGRRQADHAQLAIEQGGDHSNQREMLVLRRPFALLDQVLD